MTVRELIEEMFSQKCGMDDEVIVTVYDKNTDEEHEMDVSHVTSYPSFKQFSLYLK